MRWIRSVHFLNKICLHIFLHQQGFNLCSSFYGYFKLFRNCNYTILPLKFIKWIFSLSEIAYIFKITLFNENPVIFCSFNIKFDIHTISQRNHIVCYFSTNFWIFINDTKINHPEFIRISWNIFSECFENFIHIIIVNFVVTHQIKFLYNFS